MAKTSSTGYGPRRALLFDGNESKYELWEVKFLGYTRHQKLYDVFVRLESEKKPPDEERQADAFAELVQCLDDRSLSLVMHDARDDGRKALEILRQLYQGKGKPRVIVLSSDTKNNSGKYSKDNLNLLVDTGATSHIMLMRTSSNSQIAARQMQC